MRGRATTMEPSWMQRATRTLSGTLQITKTETAFNFLLLASCMQVRNAHQGLRRFAAGQPSVFNDAEVAMVLTVFLAIRAAQKPCVSCRMPEIPRSEKRQGLHPGLFCRKRALTALPTLLQPAGKLTSSAKVRLAGRGESEKTVHIENV